MQPGLFVCIIVNFFLLSLVILSSPTVSYYEPAVISITVGLINIDGDRRELTSGIDACAPSKE